MRFLLVATLAASAALPAFSDETAGVVHSFDPVRRALVLTDKTVWGLGDTTAVDADIRAGERVRISYSTAGEDGVTGISSVKRM